MRITTKFPTYYDARVNDLRTAILYVEPEKSWNDASNDVSQVKPVTTIARQVTGRRINNPSRVIF